MVAIKSKIKVEEKINNFYKTSNEYSKIFKNLDDLLNLNKGIKINGLILSSKENLITLLKNWSFKDFILRSEQVGTDIFHFTLIRKHKEDKFILRGDFLLFKYSPQNNIYIVLTHENYHFFNQALIRYFNLFYPLISRPFIDTSYMRVLLETYESNLKNEKIRVSRCVTKNWIRNINAKKKVGSDIQYTDLPFRDVFDKVSENEEWIKSIDFNLVAESPKDAINIIQLSPHQKFYKLFRDTRFQCSFNFTLFYQRMIEGIANKAAESFELFDNRSRIKEENFATKPLAIFYDAGIFKDKKQNFRLIEALKGIKNSSISVIHANPYLHVSYVDYRDGSSCDIWVLSDNKISIIPQIRSTPAALERLCECIFTGFREGIIKDFRGD
jgi:hypothetical protein